MMGLSAVEIVIAVVLLGGAFQTAIAAAAAFYMLDQWRMKNRG